MNSAVPGHYSPHSQRGTTSNGLSAMGGNSVNAAFAHAASIHAVDPSTGTGGVPAISRSNSACMA